jgi:hypothetical protein
LGSYCLFVIEAVKSRFNPSSKRLMTARYAAGTREILEDFFADRPIRDEYLIVAGGGLAGTGKASYTAGTGASPGSGQPVS